jgi:hypothetical protein
MAIDYSALLSDEQKKSILEQRLTQFAAEAYQHNINKQIAEASSNTDAVQAANDALAILDVSITFHQEELAKFSTDLGA